MDSLDALVKAGKVLSTLERRVYQPGLWLSATRMRGAWVNIGLPGTKGTDVGRAKGQATFVILQTKWNVLE